MRMPVAHMVLEPTSTETQLKARAHFWMQEIGPVMTKPITAQKKVLQVAAGTVAGTTGIQLKPVSIKAQSRIRQRKMQSTSPTINQAQKKTKSIEV